MSKSISQTLQVIAAVAALATRTAANLKDDGKISYMEAAGYLADIGTIREALTGITEVPAELRDLTPEEATELRTAVLAALAKAGITTRTQEITERLITWSHATVSTFLFVRNAPPVPQIVE